MPYLLGEIDTDSWRWSRMREHLAVCERCTEEQQSTRLFIEFLSAHRGELADAIEEPDPGGQDLTQLRRSWQSIEVRLDRIEADGRRVQRIPWYVHRHAVAVAACFVVGLLACWFLRGVRLDNPHTVPWETRSWTRPLSIELVAEEGRVRLHAGTPIFTAADEVKELIVGRRHRILVNSDTTLSIRAHSEGGMPGCLVDLQAGEIFVQVSHDGNPFVVSTSHALARVMGTSFAVRATTIGTTVVVTEGAVHFASGSRTVLVRTGQASTASGESRPSQPETCDVQELLAWVRYPVTRAFTAERSGASATPHHADLSATHELACSDLETIDPDHWLHRKRVWFEREFPWIFELQRALSREGIEIDYAQLLMESGDIWQFAVFPAASGRIAEPDVESLSRIAARLGFDRQWVVRNISACRPDSSGPDLRPAGPSGTRALADWAASFADVKDAPDGLSSTLLLDSLHAGVYLANTRTLVWLYIKDRKGSADSDAASGMLEPVYSQVAAAGSIVETLLLLLVTGYDQPCDEYRLAIDSIRRSIDKIHELEDKIERQRQE